MNSVHIENPLGSAWQERPNDIDHYNGAFNLASEQALSPDESIELMDSLVTHP